MNAIAVILKRVDNGWAVALTDGREVARLSGPRAKWPAIYDMGRRGYSHGRSDG